MEDPIGSFLRIRELYISYLDTAFRISDENVAEERRQYLRTPGTLCTEPLIEPLPRYAAHELEFHELVDKGSGVLHGMDVDARRTFAELVLAGLVHSRERKVTDDVSTSRVGSYRPYTHQVQMLNLLTRAENDLVTRTAKRRGREQEVVDLAGCHGFQQRTVGEVSPCSAVGGENPTVAARCPSGHAHLPV